MASVADLIERVRSFGANVMVDGSRLVIVNRDKLPAGAADYIRKNGRAVADFLCREADIEERAAIIEYDGGLSRAVAEGMARIQLSHPPEGASPADWSWYVDQAAKIMDAHLRRAA